MPTNYRIFIDTEFNGFFGELISLALVPETDIIEDYYQVFSVSDPIVPWVTENVVPYTHSFDKTTYLLGRWLNDCAALANADTLTVIADWPDDVRHLMEQLITGPGWMVTQNYRMELVIERDLCEGPYAPAIPHNALSDAVTNKFNYLYHTGELARDEEE